MADKFSFSTQYATDDHLRNHGFLLTTAGWMLSPVYDVNPFPDGTGLTLNISEDDNSLDLDVAMSVISYFRLKKADAEQLIEQIKAAVNNWRKITERLKISSKEQDAMSTAFIS